MLEREGLVQERNSMFELGRKACAGSSDVCVRWQSPRAGACLSACLVDITAHCEFQDNDLSRDDNLQVTEEEEEEQEQEQEEEDCPILQSWSLGLVFD